jgi:hypothetical protein
MQGKYYSTWHKIFKNNKEKIIYFHEEHVCFLRYIYPKSSVQILAQMTAQMTILYLP